MFHHPDQLMALNSSHLHDLKTENDRWHLATKVMQAQQQQPKQYAIQRSALHSRIHEFFHKLARPTWEAVVKPILKAS